MLQVMCPVPAQLLLLVKVLLYNLTLCIENACFSVNHTVGVKLDVNPVHNNDIAAEETAEEAKHEKKVEYRNLNIVREPQP